MKMKRTVTILLIATLGILSACAPSTERVLGESSNTYLLQRGLFERDAAFIIQNADTNLDVYRVEPPAISLRDSLVIKDVRGPTLGRIVRRVLTVTPVFEIYREDEQVTSLGQNLSDVLANVLVGDSVGDRFTVTTTDGSPNLEIRGNVFDLDYDILREGERVAHVSQGAFTRNYFVEVAQGQDDVLALEMVIALNELTAAQREANSSE